jgi:hypothetical protein
VEVPPLAARGGGVMPWFFKHCANAVRLALEPLVEADADCEVVLVELLPHAASASVAVIAASGGISRSARRRVLLWELMWILSWWC